MTRTRLVISLLFCVGALGVPWVAISAASSDSRAVVFNFAADSLASGASRAPASVARFKSPELMRLERPSFLPPKEVVRFDGESGFTSPSPLLTVGKDGRGTFTAEAVVYPVRLNARRTLFSNVRGRSGLSLEIVNGKLQASVFLRARGAATATRYSITGNGPRTHAWQQVVFIGSERGSDFEIRLLIDGKEAARGVCMTCGSVEQSRAPLILGASPYGTDFFEGFIQTVMVRNYGVPVEVLRDASVSVADGAESWWTGGMDGAIRRLESLEGTQEKIAVPFTSEGYRVLAMEESVKDGGLHLLLRHRDNDKAFPPMIATLNRDRKIQTLSGLFEADHSKSLEDVRSFTVDGDTFLVMTGDRLVRTSFRGQDAARRFSSSDWLDRHIAYLQSDWPSGSPPAWEVISPGAPPLRAWDYVRLTVEDTYAIDSGARFVGLSVLEGGRIRAWVLSRHSTGVPEARAFQIEPGAGRLSRTATHYLLPGSFAPDLQISVSREKNQDVIYSAHRGTDGGFEIHRLEPWAEQDVRRVFRSARRVGEIRFAPAGRRLWVSPAKDDLQPFLFSLNSE